MSDLQKHIQEQLKNPEFRKIWEESEADYQRERKAIKKRIESKKKSPS